jgi:hypothetical protein
LAINAGSLIGRDIITEDNLAFYNTVEFYNYLVGVLTVDYTIYNFNETDWNAIVSTEKSVIQPGDIVLYDIEGGVAWDHAAIVDNVDVLGFNMIDQANGNPTIPQPHRVENVSSIVNRIVVLRMSAWDGTFELPGE